MLLQSKLHASYYGIYNFHFVKITIKIIFTISFIGFERVVQMLIEKGANVNAVDGKNYSALLYAVEKGNIFII